MYRHILIPTDGSELSAQAVDQGVALAKTLGAQVTFLTVWPPYRLFALTPQAVIDTREEYQQHASERSGRLLAEAEQKAVAAGVDCDLVQHEHDQPWRAIIDAAGEQGCDLIAMASHGRRGVSALVLGSETQKVLTHSSLPVLVFRQR